MRIRVGHPLFEKLAGELRNHLGGKMVVHDCTDFSENDVRSKIESESPARKEVLSVDLLRSEYSIFAETHFCVARITNRDDLYFAIDVSIDDSGDNVFEQVHFREIDGEEELEKIKEFLD
jgi:hypothetical protein